MQAVAKQQEKHALPPSSMDALLTELTSKERLIDDHLHVIKQKDVVISEQKKRIELLEQYLSLGKIRHYGASKEKNSIAE